MISSIQENVVVKLGNDQVDNYLTTLGIEHFKPEIIKNQTTLQKIQIIETKTEIILQRLDNQSIENVLVLKQNQENCQIVNRIKQAWEWEAEEELIATAQTREDLLFVMGCNLKVWQVKMTSIPCLKEISLAQRANWKIDEDGSYLNWEINDIHLDLEAIRAVVEPELRQKLLLEKLEYEKLLGKAIALIRKKHHLKQGKIKGLSDRHIRRIENEGYQITLDVLKKLAVAHNLDLESYLQEIKQKIETIR
jgi:hypothetical protein